MADQIGNTTDLVRPDSGASYFLGILYVYTRYSWVFPIKTKSDAATKSKEWKSVAENQSKTRLLKLISNNGGEFTLLDSG